MASKARVGLRVKEAVGAVKLNINVDVEAAATRFRLLQKQLRLLAEALRRQYGSMIALQKNRCEMVRIVTSIANNTPLAKVTGRLGIEGASLAAASAVGPSPASPSSPNSNTENENPEGTETTTFGSISVADRNDAVKLEKSYAAIHLAHYKRSVIYADRFNQYVINYVMEWERVVSNRVNAGLKQSETLRRDLDHYTRKVESMRTSTSKTMSNGKIVGTKDAEKLKRNEQKLQKAREGHAAYTHKLFLLIDEVTTRAWKDLHPLLVKLLQFDMTYTKDEAQVFADLTHAADLLKQLSAENKLEGKGRLKELVNSGAEDLFTGDREIFAAPLLEGGNNGQMQRVPEQQAGLNDLSWAGGQLQQPQGQPDPYNSDPYSMNQQYSQQFSQGSIDDGLFSLGSQNGHDAAFNSRSSFQAGQGRTTSDMLTVAAAAAPAPTMDMLNDLSSSTGNLSLTPASNEHSEFSWQQQQQQPQQPQWSNASPASGNMGGLGGFGDLSGGGPGHQPQAPAPAAPPPPPPPGGSMSMSMYGDGQNALIRRQSSGISNSYSDQLGSVASHQQQNQQFGGGNMGFSDQNNLLSLGGGTQQQHFSGGMGSNQQQGNPGGHPGMQQRQQQFQQAQSVSGLSASTNPFEGF